MKRKLLIVGITMNAAGTEKSFLSFAENIDYSEWDVTLLLARASGELMGCIPPQIKVEEMDGGELFLLDKTNAGSLILHNYIRKNPLRAFSVMRSCVEIALSRGDKRVYAKNRLWLKAMEALPAHRGRYDLALAYWGDRTMFYTADKVNAERRITWLHFDFGKPPREKALYGEYFGKFEKVVTVSESISRSLAEAIPSAADKIVTAENIIDAKKIIRLSQEDAGIRFTGTKLITVGRICEQKGYDLALPAIARLISEGIDLKWYIIGAGSGEYYDGFISDIKSMGLEGRVILLGTTANPYKYMRACDVYVQPSRHEGKPIAVEEAKVLELPIFATEYSSAKEQLRGYRAVTGEISEEGIYSGIKAAIALSGDDPRGNAPSQNVGKEDFSSAVKRILE